MLTFLPLSHPQTYLPLLFRLWESLNSYLYDERMLQFLSRLSELHVDPTESDPRKTEEIPDDQRSEDEGRPNWQKDDLEHKLRFRWPGLYKDVGIFTEREWNLIMCKCLASMGQCYGFLLVRDGIYDGYRDPSRRRGIFDHRSQCRQSS